MRIVRHLFCIVSLCAITASCLRTPVDYVNPFIGTEYNGHTFPNAACPLGMVQPGPETGYKTWDYCSGYRYSDTLLLGFTQNRLNGTGCGDLGDILVMPFGETTRPDYSSPMDKSTETAIPGYYSVFLPETGVKAEMTCSRSTAFYKFGYRGRRRGVFIDFDTVIGGGRITGADIRTVGDREIEGSISVAAWVERTYYFVIRFNSVIDSCAVVREGGAPKYILEFSRSGAPLEMKLSLSTVSEEGARNNMDSEIHDWNFNRTRREARREWEKYINLATIKGTDDQKTNFYTCLYHLYLQPSNIADVDGRYNGADGKLHQSSTGNHYSTLSQWDTFRAANPFYTLFTPEFAADLANAMVDQCDEQGFLPIWALCGKENYCMIGNHSVPPLAEAAINGLFDAEKAYEAIKTTLTCPHRDSDWENYDKYGYLPCDIGLKGSVSRTLEMGYDDYCCAKLAEKLGRKEDAEFFYKRSAYYKNLYDPGTGLMRGRKADGSWREPFHPFSYSHDATVGGDYTEGNAWQYCWHVLQDVDGLIELMGGKDAFITRLDSLFVLHPDEKLTGKLVDVSGLIGQYAHGNEPSHHVAYLYTLAGRPERAAEVIGRIFDEFYLPKPNGLCGNDDCGQMSAWYLFSACGFYPVNPVSGKYVFGSPQIPYIRLSLPEGKQLEIIARGISEGRRTVDQVFLNGVQLEESISRDQILAGGKLEFQMR